MPAIGPGRARKPLAPTIRALNPVLHIIANSPPPRRVSSSATVSFILIGSQNTQGIQNLLPFCPSVLCCLFPRGTLIHPHPYLRPVPLLVFLPSTCTRLRYSMATFHSSHAHYLMYDPFTHRPMHTHTLCLQHVSSVPYQMHTGAHFCSCPPIFLHCGRLFESHGSAHRTGAQPSTS